MKHSDDNNNNKKKPSFTNLFDKWTCSTYKTAQ